jgi:AAA+ superfamily predicted ATPase
VQQLFTQLHQLCDDSEALVCVLIDEVESLTMARQMSLCKNEPSDGVRVVNALLTQIDALRR